MKKIIVSVLLLGVVSVLNAQTTKPAIQPVILKTGADSVSYVLGEMAAIHLSQQGLGDVKISNTAFLKGLNDILGKKKPLMDDAAANACLTTHMTKLQSEKSKPQIEAGKKFLAQNKLKPGVITTASGLQYEVITQGTGIKPTIADTFVAHYRGTLLDGTEFDASYNRGQPLTYPVNKVVPGWIEGLQLMPAGSKYKFYIPYNLGYGTMGSGQIPGGATLVFELELLEVKKGQ